MPRIEVLGLAPWGSTRGISRTAAELDELADELITIVESFAVLNVTRDNVDVVYLSEPHPREHSGLWVKFYFKEGPGREPAIIRGIGHRIVEEIKRRLQITRVVCNGIPVDPLLTVKAD